jgi:GntR family transcriptional repressor for pyruvate dehydrogenase complex
MAVIESICEPQRGSLVEAIAHGLIRYIAANGLRGGDRLPSERQLVGMVHASRLPLREALCVLKGLGIVESKHGKGIYVKDLDLTSLFGMLSPLLRSQSDIDLGHIFEARMHFEGGVAELAAANRTDEDLLVLEAALAGMEANLEEQPDYIKHDMIFHQELARSTANPIFHVFMASITDLLAELQHRYVDIVEVRRRAIEEHAEILAAVRQRDGRRARQWMETHLRNATGRIGKGM